MPAKNTNWIKKTYHQYASGKQTLQELSRDYDKNPKTLRKYFDRFQPCVGEIKVPSVPINLVIDGTFFGRSDGLIVARANGHNLLWKFVMSEKIEYYDEIITSLRQIGVQFASFTIDGRPGVRQLLLRKFPDTPVQLCQFHQLQIVTRYLSKRPKLAPSKELRTLSLSLTKTTRPVFTQQLSDWQERWQYFLQEKTRSVDGRHWHYTHQRLRRAYRSLATNLPWLFSCQDFPALTIPNTTNSCDGSFAHWKNKVRIHRGLKPHRRLKMINFLLENS